MLMMYYQQLSSVFICIHWIMFGGGKRSGVAEDSSGRFSLYGLPFPPDPIYVKTLVCGSEILLFI